MDIDFPYHEDIHRLGDNAMHPMAPRSGHHAALLGLAGKGQPRSRALLGTPITAPSGASNCVF